jgi:hypothetical protein
LIDLEKIMASRIARYWLLNGVTVRFPETVQIGPYVSLAQDVEIGAGVALLGKTAIGTGSLIGSGSQINNSQIGEDVEIKPYSILEVAIVDENSQIGPFARLRPGTEIGAGAKIGNFVETKKARFGNGAKASLALTFPGALTDKSYNNLKKNTAEQISGKDQHRILLVEEGGKVETLSLSQKDSQYLETREFSLEEICRWFRVNPHKVADLRRATFSNIEEQNIDHVNDTLMPWFIRFEQATHNQLFSLADQNAGYYVKHNANALLRGDSKTRAEFYKAAINDGWATRNEVRAWEDMNPLDGLDEPLIPLNMRCINDPIETQNNQAFVEDAAARITASEESGLSARVDKALEDRERFNEWMYGFYAKQEAYILQVIKPLGYNHGIATKIKLTGTTHMALCDDPAEHIKTWNRELEIVDIINEALACIHK